MWTVLALVFFGAVLPVGLFGLMLWWCWPCPWCRSGNGRVPMRIPGEKCTICNGWQVSLKYGRRFK